jgi:hypothetical protein
LGTHNITGGPETELHIMLQLTLCDWCIFNNLVAQSSNFLPSHCCNICCCTETTSPSEFGPTWQNWRVSLPHLLTALHSGDICHTFLFLNLPVFWNTVKGHYIYCQLDIKTSVDISINHDSAHRNISVESYTSTHFQIMCLTELFPQTTTKYEELIDWQRGGGTRHNLQGQWLAEVE